jgi:multiple sugar transport system substrate-binding protein
MHRLRSLSRYCAILVWLLLVLTVCDRPKSERVTISFLDAEDRNGAWAEVITAFERKNPGIDVNLIEGPASTNTRENQYVTSLLAGDSTYDLVYLDVVWVPKFADAGWLIPLDDRFPSEMQQKFLPGDIEASTFAGRIWRVPLRSNGGLLYYRADLLEAANINPPETFDELLIAAKRLQSPPELWGFVFQGKQYEGLTCAFLEILRGFGGEVLGPDGRCVFNSPESVEALAWIRDIVLKEKIVPNAVRTYEENEALATFLAGKSVFMRNWPYAWRLCQEPSSALRNRVGIVSMVHARGRQSSSTLGGWGFGISKFSKHPEEAWKFILHAASPESLKIAVKKQGGAPSLKSLYYDAELLSLNPHYPALLKVLLDTKPRPVHPKYAEVSDSLQRHVSAVLTGDETPEQAVQRVTTEINGILGRNL